MSFTPSRAQWVLLLIPIGLLALWFLDKDEPNPTSGGKEAYYLQYNKDEVFKNLLAAEGHFRNVEDVGVDVEGNANCVIKHYADAEQHLDEAISHAAVCEGNGKSEEFRELRNDIRDLRHSLQRDGLTVVEGIKRTRDLRRKFESFNPDFDISKCTACEITTSG